MNKRIAYSEQVDNSTTITTATAVCMAAKDLSALTAFALTVYNAGAAALNAFALEVSPDTSAEAHYVTVDNSTLASLTAGAAGRISVTVNVGKHYRAYGSVASGTTTLDIWVTGG